MRMLPVWILILSFCKPSLVPAVGLHQPSTVSVRPGEALTLNCTFPHESRVDLIVWYKQRAGQTPQEVGKMLANSAPEFSPAFHGSGLKLESISYGISLTIPHVKIDDEGLNFCGVSVWNKVAFSAGTFIAVTGRRELNISVVQSPLLEMVPPGESVSLQCTVLSERRTAELRVLWFRAAAGDSHPEIIYTHHNSSRQCEISSSTHGCVYNLSKRVLNHSDTGTYYCAVATCGKILLGNGTTVDLKRHVDPTVICVGTALGVCVVVICAQAVLNQRKRDCKKCSMRRQEGTETQNTADQDQGTVELNYTAIHFSKRQTSTGNRGRHYETLYSELKHPAVNEHDLTQ